MEGPEELEFVGPQSDNHATAVTHVAKGKRTKRHRPFSPCAVVAAMTSSSSSVSGEHLSAGGDYGSISSTTTTTTHNNYDESTEEEEDMANCLILLAQSGDSHNLKPRPQSQAARTELPGGSRRFADMPTVTASGAAKVGLFVYECKTCNRSFRSFQALGGHRASHKKPKLTLEEKKLPPPPKLINSYEIEEVPMKSSPQISLKLENNMNGVVSINKAKIHECSICGSEFTSGQALGGHMRRHRASTTTMGAAPQASYDEVAGNTRSVVDAVEVKPRVLALDLNLPAPEEEDHHYQRDSKFELTAKEKPLVLSAASLVGCHY